MQNTLRSLSLLCAIGLLAAFPLLAHALPTDLTVCSAEKNRTAFRPTFFEKMALKTAERKIRKALKKYGKDDMLGDSTRHPCGYVVLYPGERVEAELLEISATEVTYRLCGQPDAAPIIRHKREVLAVVASNGDELFSGIYRLGSSAQQYEGGLDSPKLDGIAILSLVFSLAPFSLAGPLLAVILGGISLDRINKHPDRYRGRGLALAGIIIGLIGLALVIAALAAV